MTQRRGRRGDARRGRKRSRATLKHHLEGQWVRGKGSPYERPGKPRRVGERPARRRKAMADFEAIAQPEPPTLADIWPGATPSAAEGEAE